MSIHPFRRRSALAVLASGALLLTGLTACSSSSDSGDTAAAAACASDDTPVTLSVWAWGAGWDDIVKNYESLHPNITIDYSAVPQSNDGGYQKMYNAAKAGDAPDIIFIEFDQVPAFVSAGVAVDIHSQLADKPLDDFVPGLYAQSSLGAEDALYNVPIGGGPMALFYRSDLLQQYGIPVPTTWADFADAARQVHAADPSVYLANFPSNSPNWFAGMAAQNGASWFSNDGSSWKVDVDDDATLEVASYWQELVSEGVVSTYNDFTPEWSKAFADGKLLSWPSAVWGAGVLKTNAPDLTGKWSVAQLPAWKSGDTTSASWGGGGLSVTKDSTHPCEAAQFAYWLATDVDAEAPLIKEQSLYPTFTPSLSNAAFSQPDPYFDNQVIFDQFEQSSASLPKVTWGPDMGVTYAGVSDAVAAALTSGGDLTDAIKTAQTTIVSNLEKNGVTLSQ